MSGDDVTKISIFDNIIERKKIQVLTDPSKRSKIAFSLRDRKPWTKYEDQKPYLRL